MTPVGEIEVKSQRRVISLLRDGLGHRYLGDGGRGDNRNVERQILIRSLRRGGRSSGLIAKALG